ncbi:sensor histidine kinase [Pseudoalteromonas denitrificans]|uniref:histidine kinase n=1 Tax=Pseudoalteromonas denitrificans DSM 6059 TaxID=1123010 RepID=A0A1I1EWZ5_9GAMM|nr:ATP-binding protein [Pseudoalteromonas denitrificans]SFB89423.1 His Kinase A (phospho-acceptor) domain-containing protein [Pseudoalteromonas denitrificans DSM 6059]
MKKISVSFALAGFVFLSCASLALLISALVSNQVISTINAEQNKIISREINQINNNYLIYLNQRLTILKEKAKLPIMLQTLMQPESNLGKINDFMADLTILGKSYKLSLFDFEGRLLHTTLNSSQLIQQQIPWFKSVLKSNISNNQTLTNISITGETEPYFFAISVAIKYQNSIEGILTMQIPIADINEQISADKRLEGISIGLMKNNQTLITFGEVIIGETKRIDWPKLDLSLLFTIDKSIINSMLYKLMVQISAIIIVAILITSFLAYFFGYRYFVKPLLSLSEATEKLDKGEHIQAMPEESSIVEFSSLLHKFNQMAKQVEKREQALKTSYSKLTQANDELKLSESQLVQSEKMASIGLLAAGVAHEINNPIGYVKSNLTVLNDYLNDLQEYNKALSDDTSFKDNIMAEYKQKQQTLIDKYDIDYLFKDIFPLIESTIGGIDRVDEIVQSLKIFARIEQPLKSLIDINEGLNATLKIVWNELKYNCEIHVDLQPLPMTLAFPGKLNQVFMNLLINAGQAIDDKGNIYVRSKVKDNDILIEIEDTGCGIENESLSKIFTPFYTSKPIGTGTGLGLSISHNIINQHGGQISVTSKVNQGSCFTISIPIIEIE